MKMKIEYSLTLVKENGGRSLVGEYAGFDGLTRATRIANDNGVGVQVTEEEAKGRPHAHIMEFRDDEHYNDIYLIGE